MDNDRIARLALDAATALDRAGREPGTDLSDCGRLAGILESAWPDADPIEVDDLLAALTPRPGAMATMDDLGAAVAADVALLRRAGGGDPDSRRPAMERCLRMHGVLLTRDAERFGPFGLVA